MAEQHIQDEGEIFTLVDEKGNEELYKEAMRFQNPESGKWYICLYPVEQENDEDMQTVFGLGETLLTIQDKTEYCKYCLIKALVRIADSYKDSIVDYIEKVGDGNG